MCIRDRVLKGYIILLLKVYMRILGMDLIIRLRINDLLFVFGILAMVIGSAKALQQLSLIHIWTMPRQPLSSCLKP